jgi:hypothetical protein
MESILIWLTGKKTTIAMILGAILNFITIRGYIADDTSYLISVILIAIGLGANVATNRLYKEL